MKTTTMTEITKHAQRIAMYLPEIQYGCSHFLTDEERSIYEDFAIIHILTSEEPNIELFTFDFKQALEKGNISSWVELARKEGV